MVISKAWILLSYTINIELLETFPIINTTFNSFAPKDPFEFFQIKCWNGSLWNFRGERDHISSKTCFYHCEVHTICIQSVTFRSELLPLFLSEMKGSNSGRSEYHSEAGTYYNQTVTILVRLASLTIKQQGGSEDHQENILISQTESHLHHS